MTAMLVGSTALLGSVFLFTPMGSGIAGLDSVWRFMDWIVFYSSSCGKPGIRLRGLGLVFGLDILFRADGECRAGYS